MTVNTSIARVIQNGNGVTVSFPVPFYFLQSDDLAVYVDGVLRVLTTDYAVSGAGDPAGGTVSFTAPPAAGIGNVVIVRDPDQLQAIKYPANDPFPARTHETALDKLTMLVQRTRDLIGRSFTLADADASVASLTVPTPQAGYLIGWNPGGTGLANYASSGEGSTLPLPVSIANGGTGAGSAVAARAALGLGSAALANTGVAAGNAVQLDGSARLPAVDGSQLTNLTLPAPPVVVPVRQTVLGGATDASGYANWLAAGSGLQVNYLASAAPVRIAFAGGYGDLVADLAADAAGQFGALAPSNTSFLYADRASAAGIVGGSTLVQPQYGNLFDRTKAALLHFDGTNGATTTTDDWGNSWTLTGATLSTAQQKFGASSLVCSGTSQYASTTDIKSLGGGSWCIEGFFRFSALPGASSEMTLFNCYSALSVFRPLTLGLYNNAGSRTLRLAASSNNSGDDIANFVTGASTAWATGTWYHVAVVFDALAGKYFVYKDGVQDISVTSSTRLASFGTLYIGHTGAGSGFVDFAGNVDEARVSPFCPYPNGSTFTVPNAPFAVNPAGQAACWFDIPNMTMREVTGPSASAGTNPAFTSRLRVFCGEADTGASTVGAVRNYAYRRQYRSGLVAVPGVSSRTAFAANLGVDPQFVTMKAWLRFTGAWNGYSAGMCVPLTMFHNGTNPPPLDPNVIEDQNTCAVLSTVGGVVVATPRSAPATYLSVPSGTNPAQLFIEARGTF